MKLKCAIVLFTACFLQFSCATQKKNFNSETLTAAELKPFGRTMLHQQKGLELISSAVHFGFSFEGESCQVFAAAADANSHGYLQYELDGVYQKRIRVAGKDSTPIQITVPAGKHEIKIFKATEAHSGPIFISKITAKNIKALTIKKAPIIEFIGNSITCGAAADDSEIACGAGEYHDQHNAYMAYGPRVARLLKVNYFLSSVSGIGVYRNWNSDGPAMPEVYEKVDFQTQRSEKWDFATYNPKVVSIALGTNDFSNGDGKNPRKPFDPVMFTEAYVKFIQLVKSKYPKAQIALLSSPMVKGDSRTKLQDCLKAVKQKVDLLYPSDQKVATFFFEPMEARGCTGHPNVEDHKILADQLQGFFAGLL